MHGTINMGSDERSDASIAVLTMKIAIIPYDDDDNVVNDDDDNNELAWGRGGQDKEITLIYFTLLYISYFIFKSGAVR